MFKVIQGSSSRGVTSRQNPRKGNRVEYLPRLPPVWSDLDDSIWSKAETSCSIFQSLIYDNSGSNGGTAGLQGYFPLTRYLLTKSSSSSSELFPKNTSETFKQSCRWPAGCCKTVHAASWYYAEWIIFLHGTYHRLIAANRCHQIAHSIPQAT